MYHSFTGLHYTSSHPFHSQATLHNNKYIKKNTQEVQDKYMVVLDYVIWHIE